MDTNIFESAFFGWKNLPNMIEYQEKKLIPLKTLKLKNGGNATHHDGLFSVSEMKSICKKVGITVYRPIVGLYCISKDDCDFFSYLHDYLKSLIDGNYKGDGCSDSYAIYCSLHKEWENLIACYYNFRAQIVV